MRLLLPCLILLAGTLPMHADKPEAVTKEDAVEAFRQYRIGMKLISSIHSDSLQRAMSAKLEDEIKLPNERIRDYKEARRHLEKSIALNPYLPEAYVLLANSYWDIENDLAKTAEYYGKALEIDPEWDDVISARGQVYMLLKRIEDAEKDLHRLEAMNSDFAKPLREQIAKFKTFGEQPGTGQPATRPVDTPEGGDKPKPEAEGRSR